MATLHFDSSYASCGFLIVKTKGDPYNDNDTTLIQSDWDYAGVASSIGWIPCKCGSTDGTVDCEACNRKVSDMLSEAYDYCQEHEGEEFETLDCFFE